MLSGTTHKAAIKKGGASCLAAADGRSPLNNNYVALNAVRWQARPWRCAREQKGAVYAAPLAAARAGRQADSLWFRVMGLFL